MNKLNNKQFALVLGCIGNMIGFSSAINISRDNITIDYTDDIIFRFINNGGITKFNPSKYVLSSEVLFLLDVIKSKNINEVKNNFKYRIKMIEDDENERNLDIITKFSIENNDNKYNEEANSSFVIIRSIPFSLDNDMIKKSIEITKLTHNNDISILGGISCAIITKLSIEKVDINKWIKILINKLEEIVIKVSLGNKEKYIDKLKLYLERNNKNKALIYPRIRSEYYYRNFNNSKYIYYGNLADDSIIISYDILINCIIDGIPSYEKLIYYGALHLGESSLIGFLSSFWYGLYFGKTDDIPNNLFIGIEFMNDIIKLGNLF
jgi:hypothetical protein